MTTSSEAALNYIARGWAVIPMHSITEDGRCSCGALGDYTFGPQKHIMGKHPYTEHGHKDASKTPSQIALWWTMWPDANVAIATGEKSGLVVVDVDVKGNGYASLAALERQYGPLPKTPRVLSGGGGLHLYFKHPGIEVRGRRGMRPGIDVFADGGRIVAPPSKHKSGWTYRWDEQRHPDVTEIAPLPSWLFTVIKTKNTPQKRPRRIKHWF